MVHPRRWSLGRQILALQALVAALVVGTGLLGSYLQARQLSEQRTQAEVLAVAHAVAASPEVVDGIAQRDPASALKSVIEAERARTGTDFIVVMSTTGVRYTHPNAQLVGQHYSGTIAPAVAGGEVVESYVGSLGPSVRAVVPVFREGVVAALVSVGVRRQVVAAYQHQQIPGILLAGLATAGVAGIGTMLVARRVRGQTRGLGAQELARVVDHHQAVLGAVREGLVIVSASGTLEVANDAARELLALDETAVGRRVAELGLPAGLARLLTPGAPPGRDVPIAQAGRLLVVNTALTQTRTQTGRRRGRAGQESLVATLRDRTELEDLTDRLGATSSLADALHAQAHEAKNRLHTVVSLIELGRPDEAARFATAELAASQRYTDAVLAQVREPAAAALVMGKMSQADERAVRLELDPDALLPAGLVDPASLVTILGNLVDNALDAVAGHDDGLVSLDAQPTGRHLVLTVADNGPGLAAEAAASAFERGWTTKPSDAPGGRGLGLALVAQTVARLGGTITISNPPGAVFTITVPVTPSPAPRATYGDADD